MNQPSTNNGGFSGLRVENLRLENTGSVFTSHSQGHSLSFSPIFYSFECITATDWLNRMI